MFAVIRAIIMGVIFGIGRSVKGLTLPFEWVAKLDDDKWAAKLIFYVTATFALMASFYQPILDAWGFSPVIILSVSFILIAKGSALLFQPGYKRDENGYKWNPEKVALDRVIASIPIMLVMVALTKSFWCILVSPVAVGAFYAAYWCGEKYKKHQLMVSELVLGTLFFLGCDVVARIIGGGV
jgi:hypothetical protein